MLCSFARFITLAQNFQHFSLSEYSNFAFAWMIRLDFSLWQVMLSAVFSNLPTSEALFFTFQGQEMLSLLLLVTDKALLHSRLQSPHL